MGHSVLICIITFVTVVVERAVRNAICRLG